MNSDWSNYKSAPQFSTPLCFATASKARYLPQRSRTSRLLSPAKVKFNDFSRVHTEKAPRGLLLSIFFRDFVPLHLRPEGLYVIGQSRVGSPNHLHFSPLYRQGSAEYFLGVESRMSIFLGYWSQMLYFLGY